MNRVNGFYWDPSSNDIDNQIQLLERTGASAVFIPHRLVDQLPLLGLHNHGIQIYVDFGLFVGEHWWNEFPDSVPINSFGDPLKQDDWYIPVCPNHPQVRTRNIKMISTLIQKYSKDIDGIWLDFIRYPIRWEVRRPNLQYTCFCKHCLTLFLNCQERSYSKREIAEHAKLIIEHQKDEWIEWKCSRITDFVKEVRALIAVAGASIELGMFSLPWRQNDYRDAIRAVAGQDLARLAEYVEVISPMTYHKLCYQPTRWIEHVILDVHQRTKKPVLPIIQSLDLPTPVSLSEFDEVLTFAMAWPAKGVMIFTLEPLLNNTNKQEIVIKHFQ